MPAPQQHERGELIEEIGAFNGIRHEDAQGDYWLARELAGALGYGSRDSWRNFERVIGEAKIASESQGYDVAELFVDVDKKSSGGRPAQDYRLTRFACYMIALSADGTKEQVAAAKVYFAIMTRDQEMLRALIRQLGDDPMGEVVQRLLRRQELTEAHKVLLARARDAGVITSQQFARFIDWGYKGLGLYDGETENDIHDRKGLTRNQHISDWMGLTETMANILRAIIATKRMEHDGARTPRDANRTHFIAGQTVRGWLVSEGIVPEELPTPTRSYKQLVIEEAARLVREDDDARGLWARLTPPDGSGPPRDAHDAPPLGRLSCWNNGAGALPQCAAVSGGQ